MSVTIEILKNGFSSLNLEKNVMKANCTCTLIIENKNIIIVDTLTAWDSLYLKQELLKRGIDVKDVTHAIGTHGHSDHIGNLNLFTNALHIVGQSINHKDEYQLHSFGENNPYKISENVEVIATPGHTLSDVSVLVKNSSMGTVAVVGDLFEREEDIGNSSLWIDVAGSENPELQYKNRCKILQLADYIVPGHGPIFKVTEELKSVHGKMNPSSIT